MNSIVLSLRSGQELGKPQEFPVIEFAHWTGYHSNSLKFNTY